MKNTHKKREEKKESKLLNFINQFLRIDKGVIHVYFLPQIIFLAILCLIYIGNLHYTEKKIRYINRLETEVEDLRADYTTLKASFMYESKQSEISKRVAVLGLKESKELPILIREVDY